ncbi:cytochrome P450 monooxygenase [Fusarium beomiforme]|uniref:Cytochrome P450 monooxygenase n=1 Tax=Fusarium beomiforme TaxID=44412 RepID=A0A9P5AI26_9HYPO|nr:cytochrome P450 monooxygenase [Fusarium beomiforme]
MTPLFLKKMEPFFTLRNKIPLQIVLVILILTVITFSGVRLVLPNRPPGRSTTMGLGMGAKSLIILSYEILTEHSVRFHRWSSLKAYFILNAMEVVFWAAVAFMMIRGNTNVCVGTSCALGWVVFVLAGILSPMYKYLAVVTYLDWRFFKKNGFPRGARRKNTDESLSTLRSDSLPETAYGH